MSRFRAHGRSHRTVKPNEHAIQTPFIQEWLKEPDKLVSRRELYEFIGRLERGRARANSLWRRLGWAWQRLWRYLTSSPLETTEKPKEG